MAKSTVRFVCANCGATQAKWSGRCSNCGQWNTLQEQIDARSAEKASAKAGHVLNAQPITGIKLSSRHKRLSTGLSEVDMVLGGGIVPASVLLLAGEPGIGKSTLLTQVAAFVADSGQVLYVSAEESTEQIYQRAQRLHATNDNFKLSSTTNTDDIVATMHEGGFSLVIVDSIQTIASELAGTAPGSPSQISMSSQLLIRAAKQTNTALIVVGHVTKEGGIAGPKLLEHLVDVV